MAKRNLDEIEKLPSLPKELADGLERESINLSERVAGQAARLHRILKILKKPVTED